MTIIKINSIFEDIIKYLKSKIRKLSYHGSFYVTILSLNISYNNYILVFFLYFCILVTCSS